MSDSKAWFADEERIKRERESREFYAKASAQNVEQLVLDIESCVRDLLRMTSMPHDVYVHCERISLAITKFKANVNV